ncbi:hypothetical protein [Microbulbifer thermotolerans]|uniref:Lipoprotein n=1 Tax=Microbulbifer thermotolerans TaxID=252514 RepID=A0AB35I4K2_MICTH|nr:hypothetical protein [Microbulbifer thermotolerans]MCX2781074.1 hypothetical protein [Microbulbifer thermotolerans]MCX2782047.1 hypothetical protein [Microbulbifer thermotolerans]MCX2796244.1 hypothetical protein [Microbulbifer thermotolerans]MCX2803270.1 hypothetical protein [Microbulbifer thermotolerans]MCX2806391.1 hypothetical protein [Microbulbifer thermotolerans]
MQKLCCILLAVAMATGVAGCSTTAPKGAPKALTVNGQKFHCIEQELDSKILVRCVPSP